MYPGQDPQLMKANKKIADLKEDILRLSEELRSKEALLARSIEVAHEQSLQLTSFSVALCDKDSCSTPNGHKSWAEILRRGKQRSRATAASPPLSLSNRFITLLQVEDDVDSDEGQSSDPGSAMAASAHHPLPPAVPQGLSSAALDQGHPATVGNLQPSPRTPTSTSASRRRLLREAVRRRSENPYQPGPREIPCREDEAAAPAPDTGATGSLHQMPRPLFSPTSLIVGDSIVRNIKFFNTITRCFPGATVPVILEKLPELLQSAPSSIHRVIIHVGSNDTSWRQSEATKAHFKELFSLLESCGKSVFISGALPTLTRSVELLQTPQVKHLAPAILHSPQPDFY